MCALKAVYHLQLFDTSQLPVDCLIQCVKHHLIKKVVLQKHAAMAALNVFDDLFI